MSPPPDARAGRDALAWLLAQLRPFRRAYAGVTLLTAAGAALTAVDPLVMKWVLDTLIPTQQHALLPLAAVGFLLSYTGRYYFDQEARVLATRLSRAVIATLRIRMMRRLLALPGEHHDSVAVGATLFQINEDVRQVADTAVDVVLELTRVSVVTTATLIGMWYLDWHVALVVSPCILAYALFQRRCALALYRAALRVQAEAAAESALSHQIVGGALQVQLLGAEHAVLRRFLQRLRATRDAWLARARWDYRMVLVARACVIAALALVLGYGGYLVSRGVLTLGVLVALYTYVMRVCEPLPAVVDLDSRLDKGRASLHNVYRLFTAPVAPATVSPAAVSPAVISPAVISPAAVSLAAVSLAAASPTGAPSHVAPRATPLRAALALRDVTFAYPGRPAALQGVTFSVQPGERVALVGNTGAGKTTILRLILRFYGAYGGAILVNGTEVATLDPRGVRAMLAVVPQDILLFDGTLRENLLLANPRATRTDVDAAATCSQLDDVLRRLPRGFEQTVGPQGTQLSGGEKQRLALARALIRPASLLLLDEFSSALDTDTERRVLQGLERTARHRTMLVISHRPAVVSWADRVVVLHGGRVIADGTHAALMRRHDYAARWREALEPEAHHA